MSEDTVRLRWILVIVATLVCAVLWLATFLDGGRHGDRVYGGTVRRRFSEAECTDTLERVKAGVRYQEIAADGRCSRKTIQRLVNYSTSVLPAWVFTGEARLAFGERDEIANGLRNGESLRAIASRLDRARSTISREVRHGSDRHGYRPFQPAVHASEPLATTMES